MNAQVPSFSFIPYQDVSFPPRGAFSPWNILKQILDILFVSKHAFSMAVFPLWYPFFFFFCNVRSQEPKDVHDQICYVASYYQLNLVTKV